MQILTDDQNKAVTKAIASYYLTWGQRSCYNSPQDVLRATYDDGFEPVEQSGIELSPPSDQDGEAWDEYWSQVQAELNAIDERVRAAIDTWFTTTFEAEIIEVD